MIEPITFTSVAPVIPVRNLDAALERYRRLGFTATAYTGPERYGYVERGGVSLHLTEWDQHDPARTGAVVYLYVSDADALHAEWARAGVKGRLVPPHDTPYQLREFAFVDDNGTAHRVGSPPPGPDRWSTLPEPTPEEQTIMPLTSQKITPFLMFEGTAEEAMTLYLSLFDDARVIAITRYGPNQPGAEGTVQHATFELAGQQFMCIDSFVHHDFTFTPSISFYVECATETEIDRLYAALAEQGEVLMPLGAYDFSERFAWVKDRFGVSWQLTLAGRPVTG